MLLVPFLQVFFQRLQQLKNPSKTISARHEVRLLETELEIINPKELRYTTPQLTLMPLVSLAERSMSPLPSLRFLIQPLQGQANSAIALPFQRQNKMPSSIICQKACSIALWTI